MASVKTSIGIFVDGQEVKLARLAFKRGAVVLEELEAQHLDVKLDEQHQMTEASLDLSTPSSTGETGDFSAPPVAQEPVAAESGGDNHSIFLGLT